MAIWAPRQQREVALQAAETQILAQPDAVEPRFARACLLEELGRPAEATTAFLDLLRQAPGHLGSLLRLGNLLLLAGHDQAAETAYREAIALHPANSAAHVNLGNLLMARGMAAAARGRFEVAIGLDPGLAEAHQGLAHALDELGEARDAEAHRRLGYGSKPLFTLPYHGRTAPVPILLLISAAGGNVAAADVLDPAVFLTSVLVTEYADLDLVLPPHDAIFNAIGDAETCGRALEAAALLLQRTPAPAINPPAAVLRTSRAENARRFARVPGVRAPAAATLPRELVRPDTLVRLRIGFPLLLRAPGYHGGRRLVRVDTAAELGDASAALPGPSLTAVAFADVRSPDGWVRKYRVMTVNGQLYPAHLAISREWKAHYASAETSRLPALRAEEDGFLRDMPRALGPRAMAALERVARVLALDYGGIDFAIGPGGEVVVFEANATMVASPPAGDGQPDLRHAAAERVRQAVREMVLGLPRAAVSG